jgi:anti-anti-sigma regulatory factor
MLSFTMHLSSAPAKGDGNDEALAPLAIAEYAVHGKQKCLLIKLKGVILEESANLMSIFFEDILSLPADRWLLQLQDLRCISGAGLRNLARFVRILRRRGLAVEIIGIHQNVYHLLSGGHEVAFGQSHNRRLASLTVNDIDQ